MRGKHNLGSLQADPLTEKAFGDNPPQGKSFYWHLKAEKQRPVWYQNGKPQQKTTELIHNILDLFTSPSTKEEICLGSFYRPACLLLLY